MVVGVCDFPATFARLSRDFRATFPRLSSNFCRATFKGLATIACFATIMAAVSDFERLYDYQRLSGAKPGNYGSRFGSCVLSHGKDADTCAWRVITPQDKPNSRAMGKYIPKSNRRLQRNYKPHSGMTQNKPLRSGARHRQTDQAVLI